jgi:hypothetical protein
MIWESLFWKEEIARIRRRLENKRRQAKWADRWLARLEKDVMLSFFMIRKLIEAKKLSQGLLDSRTPVLTYAPTGKLVHHFNWHRLSELYQLTKAKREDVTLEFLCNQIIRSYVFAPLFTGRKCTALLFCSDWQRNRRLYRLSMSRLTSLLHKVASDSPAGLQARFDKSVQDYRVLNW